MKPMLEIYPLQKVTVHWDGLAEELHVRKAELYVDISDFEKSWYIDIPEMNNLDLLERLYHASNIQVRILALSAQGTRLEGDGYMHPNLPVRAASIRGDGRLLGYELLKKDR